ncbi:hypothetical protein OVW19_27740, partial [Klebsiella pneumoniae]|uniref:hypothetical protein n=1 Tax=Klebsiella pneumoniae TaxID=573 RepID=UPI00227161C9
WAAAEISRPAIVGGYATHLIGDLMGWFSTDYLKLDILMHLNITARTGRGSIRWTPLAEHPKMSQSKARIALAALNYGRLLVNQKETGADLFQ